MTKTARENVLQFIKQARAKPKPPKNNALKPAFSTTENSVFHHAREVKLNRVAIERLEIAINSLEAAAIDLMQAEAALVGFDDIEKLELGLAQNFTHGYIYMLAEYVRLAKNRREGLLAQKAAKL